MNSLKIEGNAPLSGRIHVGGNKNAVLPMIAAGILSDQLVVIKNAPDLLDVRVMLEIAQFLGAEVDFADSTIKIKAGKIKNTAIPRDLCSKVRASMLFAGALAARCGACSLYPPGGDVIGRRRLDGHFYGLSKLGIEIHNAQSPFTFKRKGKSLRGCEMFLDEASVTATAQVLITAVLAAGTTVLRNAASEPHISNLCEMLIAMGAKISGMGSNTLTIEGVERLNGTEISVDSDHIEAGSFIALGAATGGDIRVDGITRRHYWMTRRVFERLGFEIEMGADFIRIPGGQTPHVKHDFGNQTPIISDGPWPQYPSDMMSCTIVAATQVHGAVLFFEKMFESRIYFVDRLISMGANAIVCDPHRVLINGVTPLRAAEQSSPDIRAGMAMLIAALCARGSSIIHNSDVIDRGYENINQKILSLGGRISLLQ